MGAGATPMHIYIAPGNYNVVFRVTDPEGNFDEDVTTVTILAEIPVTLLLKNGKSTINLGDPDVLKLAIEELEQPYAGVLVGTVRLSTDFPNAGTVAECAADSKHTRIGDLDRNGVPDLELRFPMACVRNLFRNTPNNSTVNLILTGQFQTEAGMVPLRGVKVVTIKRGGGGSAPVLAYPNPFNPQGRLSFMTTRPGSASVQLFDLQGRLVKTVLPQQYLGAGDHMVTIDGLSDQGTSLSSGVYYYRVSTADGVTEGSISLLK
jgi:flagellar hook capping protein FlgD